MCYACAFPNKKAIEDYKNKAELETTRGRIASYNIICDEYNRLRKRETELIKPPLGIKPKFIHDEQRREELKQAINRYFEANKPIPMEWIEEYNELVGDKK